MGLAACGQVSGLETEARILASPPCTDFFFPVYFADGSSEVSPAALRVIRNAGRQAEGCRDPKVAVVGLADPGADPGADAAAAGPPLSRQRARRLAAALRASGLPAAGFQADALGGAARPTPQRRRVDVFVRFEH
jgi:outer membrane protein OmpA-like peptidoglycan-associated protein